MDNQFENYYGFEPQKPLTEKKNTEEAAPEDFSGEEALDFEPQRPLVNQENREQPSGDSGFNPIRHTAVYSDNGFSGAPEPQHQPPQPPQPPEPPQPPSACKSNARIGQDQTPPPGCRSAGGKEDHVE